MSQSSTPAPEEDGPDLDDRAAESEFVWASLTDPPDARQRRRERRLWTYLKRQLL